MTTTVTSTIRSSGGDYTTLTAWESAKQANLVTADQIQVAECYNDWPGGLDDALTIDGSTTDSTRYLKIKAASGNGHTGVPKTGFYIHSTNAYANLIYVKDSYTRVENIECDGTGVTNTIGFREDSGGDNTTWRNCIAVGFASSGRWGFGLQSTSSRAINCLAINCKIGFWSNYSASSPVQSTILNCVAICGANSQIGVDSSDDDLVVTNTVAMANGYTSSAFGSRTWTNASYCAEDDSSLSGKGSNNTIHMVSSAAFSNLSSSNFHLSGTGSVLYNAGTDLSGTFTTDIDGDTWANWSIGFDQYTSAGPTYTLTAATGSFTKTGIAASLKFNRVLASATGSFSLSGKTAILSRNRIMAASAGAFTLTGNAAALTAQRKLTAAVGAFTLTGNAATLTYSTAGSYTLTASTGSFALTGNAAALTAARRMTAAAGAFTLTGNAATLLRPRTLTAASGAFTLTGYDAVLTANVAKSIVCETGAFSFTGHDAALIWSGTTPVARSRFGARQLSTGGRFNLATSRRR
jgi:hypothetical protein